MTARTADRAPVALPTRLELIVAKTVREWPPLEPAQLDRLALLLRGGAGDDEDEAAS